MTKPTSLIKNHFLLVRKCIGLSAFVMGCLCLGLMLVGFVPFQYQSMSLPMAFKNTLEFLNYTRRPFWDCTLRIAFSIVYYILVIKSLRKIFQMKKSLDYWLKLDTDTVEIRNETRAMVNASSIILWRLLLVAVISYAIFAYHISFLFVFIITLLILINIAMHMIQGILYTEELENSVVSSVSIGLMLASPLVFTVMSHRIQILDTINSVIYTFKAKAFFSTGYLMQMIAQNILIPIICIAALISMLALYPAAIKRLYDIKLYPDIVKDKNPIIKKGRGLFLRTAIFTFLLSFLLNDYISSSNAFKIISNNLILIVAPLMIYLCSRTSCKTGEEHMHLTEENPPCAEAGPTEETPESLQE